MAWATGPESNVPTKLPAIAAPVQMGNNRFAWRASNTDPAIVQADCDRDRADGVHGEPRQRHRRGVAGGDQQPLDEKRGGRPEHHAGQQPDARDPAERRAVRERGDEPGDAKRDEEIRERLRAEPADDQRVDADLAEASSALETCEQPATSATVRPSPGRRPIARRTVATCPPRFEHEGMMRRGTMVVDGHALRRGEVQNARGATCPRAGQRIPAKDERRS